ncbi:hypothetical protein SKAU_G00106260 [Synaphobranchus kaupii]|uniref:Uncharacterized protein n=1 Tax=Synaphobranchus kaupii TaxID=118154 RepID=A0A9Q1FZC8_SYNKA|nr:hypothetical protein SKAU_G00106260 [Synaphobranchus kaupii]
MESVPKTPTPPSPPTPFLQLTETITSDQEAGSAAAECVHLSVPKLTSPNPEAFACNWSERGAGGAGRRLAQGPHLYQKGCTTLKLKGSHRHQWPGPVW